MDETKDNEILNTEGPNQGEEYELSHTDKLVGLFTEPAAMFEKIAKFPPKAIDWVLPVILLIVFAILSNVMLMTNPLIKQSIVDEQLTEIEKRLDEAVEAGQMTQQQADERLDQTRDFMENQLGATMIIQFVATVIIIFIIVFVVAGVFLLLSKTLLKGEGSYVSSLVAYGLPFYIGILGIIVMIIVSMATDKMFEGVSLANLLGADKKEIGGYLLSKVELFSIWFHVIIGIAYAKMFKSPDTGKFIGMVFTAWIIWSLIIFYLAQALPILQGFLR